MRLRAAYIRDAVSKGLVDIDDIRKDYNLFKGGGPTRKLVFLKTLELSLLGNSRYNTPGWRKYLTDLALMESGYNAGITNSIGAKGYFQLMPSNRSATWNNPTQQFTEMYRISDSNMDYLRRNMTKADLLKANKLGIDIYGLMAGAHLGGARNALRALRGTKNAKDINGTSVMSYMTRFSQTPRRFNVEGRGFTSIIDNTGLDYPEEPTAVSTQTPEEILQNVRIPEPINVNDEPIIEADIPEVTVIGHTPPPNPLEILSLIQEVAPALKPIEPYLIPSVLNKVNEITALRNTFLQLDLEDRILAEERRRRLGYSYRDSSLENDIRQMLFLRNMSADGGNLFPVGGPMITVNPGDRVSTDQCAAWSNQLLRDNGYMLSGNAWGLNGVDMLFNGFDGLLRPETYDSRLVMAYNHSAADNVFKNFDSKTLDTSKPYIVNMFYNNSPALEDAYNEGKGVTGTHTGVLTYDPDNKKWWVTHNIHGNIHQEPFVDLQSGKGQYGVTAIYKPRKSNVWNRVKGFFGFANGGPLSDDEYYTLMEKVAEENNPKWNKLRKEEGLPLLSVDEELIRILNDNSYNYRGYYNKYPDSAANADTHWPDEFKTAFHPLFSIESGYSGQKSLYNPNGYLGGIWLGEKFIPAFWQRNNKFEEGGIVNEEPIDNEGTPADASWHENWLTNRQEQFDENYEGATEAEKQRFADNNTSTISGQLDNLRNTVEYSDLEAFERALPENTEHLNSAFVDGAVRSAGDHNALWSKGIYGYGHDSTQHERTHALNPVYEDLGYYTGVENPQDSKINRILNKYGDSIYYTGDDYTRSDGTIHHEYSPDEYLDTPEEIYAELNEFRKRAGLSPDYKVTREDIQRWRDSFEDKDSLNITLKRFNDDALLEFFNDVAYNPIVGRSYVDNNYAALGGPIVRLANNSYSKNIVPIRIGL